MTRLKSKHESIVLWRLGFRPFFLLASIFAVISILLWIGIFLGIVNPPGVFNPVLFHAHEMIYGYTTAVIAGFVLTASQNWTGKQGVNGKKLQFLTAVWISGRILIAVFSRPHILVSLIDLSFYPCLAFAMIPYLKPIDMKVERIFFVYFLFYFIGNLLMHLEALGFLPGQGMRGALLGLNTTILMIVFMGGRVIPFFTESELSRNQPKIFPGIEMLSHFTSWVFLICYYFMPDSSITAGIAFFASVIHFLRLTGWYVRRVRKIPILWVLYFAYFWIVIGFALFGLVSLGMFPLGSAVHAFTVGGLGIITYGMMSRVALGHTGRKLRPKCLIVGGYFLLNLAGLIRVIGPIILTEPANWWVITSGVCWSLAFVSFLGVYGPMLIAPRIDNKVG